MVDKYYTFDEYKSMNAEQKRHLYVYIKELVVNAMLLLLILKKRRMTRNQRQVVVI
jgi:hypothetical protein